jgi:hypothetical protein
LSTTGPDQRPKLAIIVPYRDRATHLAAFVPHIRAYFERDKVDRGIDYTVHVVEQVGSASFNRGKLINVGFRLAGPGFAYCVFHDVDYLPIWADYSFADRPTRLIWHGLRLREDYHGFFGAVVLVPAPLFERVNGFSNGYVGWGFEDTELLLRFRCCGIEVGFRDGTYIGLPHEDSGLERGRASALAVANRERFLQRRERLATLLREDGLSDLRFDCRQSGPLLISGRPVPRVFLHRVEI